ncbi:heterogeneous nuclear [Nannochloropsis oceanica]
MERHYAHSVVNPSDYGAVDYTSLQEQMVYRTGPGQHIVGSALVSVQGMPPHVWPSETHALHLAAGNSPSTSAASGHVESSSGNGQEMLEDFLGPFPVVRLRGLPFEAQVRDVILFFQGIGVLDVVMMNKGECMVLFRSVMDMQLALGRDRQNMGRRYIEIFIAKRFDYYNAIAQNWEVGRHRRPHHHYHPDALSERAPGGEREGVHQEYHAAQLYHQHYHHHNHQHPHQQQQHAHVHCLPHQLLQQDVQMPQPHQQQQGIVSSSHSRSQSHAAHNAHHAPSSSTNSKNKNNNDNNHHKNSLQGQAAATPGVSREVAIAATEQAQNSEILKMRGLPFTSTKLDVQVFFEDFNVQLDNIHVVLRADGRMTGEAFVSFASAMEARSAQKAKDRSTLGSRYVELFRTTPEELARSMIGQQYHHQQEQQQQQQQEQQRQQQGATAAGNSGSTVETCNTSSTRSETNDTTTSSSSAGNINDNNEAFLKKDDEDDLAAAAADVATLTV